MTLLLTKECKLVPFMLRIFGGGATGGAVPMLAVTVRLPAGGVAFALLSEIEVDMRRALGGGVPILFPVTEFVDPLLVAGRLVVSFRTAELSRLLPPGTVDLVLGPVSGVGLLLLDDVFEAIPIPVIETPPLVGDTVMPLPFGSEEVPFLVAAVSPPVALPPALVALPPPLIGFPMPLLMLVTGGLPTPALLSIEFGLADKVFADGHIVGPGAP